MSKLPRPTGKGMLQFLKRQGFSIVRIRGSHHVVQKGEFRITIPVHKNDLLRIGTLQGILRDIKMAPLEFADCWHKKPRL